MGHKSQYFASNVARRCIPALYTCQVRRSLPNNLEAASTAPESDAPTVALTDLPVSYQELLVAAQTELQPQSGALNMFVDLPPR